MGVAPGVRPASHCPSRGAPIRALAFDAATGTCGRGHRRRASCRHLDRSIRARFSDRRQAMVRVTSAGHNARPIWTADGGSVMFASRDDGPFNLFRAPADATAAPTRLLRSPRNQLPASVSADGRLVYTQAESDTGLDIWAMLKRFSLMLTGRPERFVALKRTACPFPGCMDGETMMATFCDFSMSASAWPPGAATGEEGHDGCEDDCGLFQLRHQSLLVSRGTAWTSGQFATTASSGITRNQIWVMPGSASSVRRMFHALTRAASSAGSVTRTRTLSTACCRS